MKLDNKNSIFSSTAGRFRSNTNAKKNSNPYLKRETQKLDDISFTGDFTRIVDKAKGTIIYSDMGKISDRINKALGDNFFTKTVEKAKKAGLTVSGDKLHIPNQGLHKDLWRTLKYPFVDLIPDLANAAAKGMKKVPLLSGAGKWLGSLPVLAKRAEAREAEASLELVSEIMDNFANHKAGKKIANGLEFSLRNCEKNFKSKVASNVTKLAKNYSSRDERTINRMVTATVSAVYGMWDFQNISMLQKDNKAEAKKAGKSRFKQEMTRMAFNAGTTFLTLGALDKYIKNSMFLSVAAIGASAFLAEVGSRVLNKKPLRRLTSKEAEAIALKRHPEMAETLKNADKKAVSDGLNFKQKLEDTNKIFVQFQSKDGITPAMKCLQQNKAQNCAPKKSKIPVMNIILGAAGIASVAYLASAVLKGDFKYKKGIKALYDKFGENMPKDKVEKLLDEKDKANSKYSIFKPIKKFLTTKKETVRLDKLTRKLKAAKSTESGKKITATLDDYIKRIGNIAETEGNEYIIEKPSVLREGLYNGFSRLFNNVYTILSMPGRLIEIALDNTIYKKSNMVAEQIEARMIKNPKMKDIITSLDSIIGKAKTKEAAADEIGRATRKFASGPETGSLAGLARTLVTAISTYFFVNDYANSVLIESAGRDTQRAKAEQNERLAQKGANFVINGTLMNLFNSIFVKPLNSSLIGAAWVPGLTEVTNEFLVRKSICQPVLPKNSKQEIIDYEEKQLSRKGPLGTWSRFFKKVTGKKSLTQKTGITNKKS